MSSQRRWWNSIPAESFWLDVTRRPDLGDNLKAPQTNESGKGFWSYSLIQEICEGDTIFHYDGDIQAIVARSKAIGNYWVDDLLWAARGASARSANVVPHSRPGWFMGLENYERLTKDVALDSIRAKAAEVKSLTAGLSFVLRVRAL